MSSETDSRAGAFARFLNFPEWLAEQLKGYGLALARHTLTFDARTPWRWLALNWHHVVAWWITAGLLITGLVLLISVTTGKSAEDQVFWVFNRLWPLAGNAVVVGDRIARMLLVLGMPVLLPIGLTLCVIVLGVATILGLLFPFAALFVLAYCVVMAAALLKFSWDKSLWFVEASIARKDQTRLLLQRLAQTLGLTAGPAVGLDGAARVLEGDELSRVLAANATEKRGAAIALGMRGGQPLVYWTEKHVYITAPTRAGKGVGLIIPNLRFYLESVFVLDPKGENCKATAAAREAKGNRVVAFDPYGLTGRPSVSFNPLAGLTESEAVRGADYIAEALVIGEDDHWNESGRGLIRALVLHLLTAPEDQLYGHGRDLPGLRALLSGGLNVVLDDMTKSEALGGLVARLGSSIKDLSPNERGSVVSVARRDTKWLDNPQLAELFRDGPNTINFEDLRDERKRLSVFVCLPPDTFGAYPQVCRLLSTFAMDTMMRTLTGRTRPVQFILDELAQLKHLPIVQRAFTLGAGYGLQVWAVFQSVEQAKKLYPLDTLYGSSGVRLFFKIEDPESCEFASKCTSGLFTPAAVRLMPGADMLALLDGANPLQVQRFGPPKAKATAA